MFSFVIKRLLQAILVMLIVTMIAFLLFQFVGDPVTQMLGQEATEADRLALTHELGLDQPIWKQFGAFIANTLHGDFGMSLRQGTPVVDLFKEKMPATLELAFFSAMVATFMGIPLGKLADGTFTRGDLAADLFYRYFADPCFLRLARLAAVLRTRRDGCVRLVDNRSSYRRRSETYHPSCRDISNLSNCVSHAIGTQ